MKKLLGVCLIFLLIGCGGNESPTAPTVNDSPTTVAQADLPLPTPTTAVESTLPPPPTIAPAATATIASEAIAPTIAAETATVLNSREEFGADRNLLTGELVADPAVLMQRPLAVKISNAPPNFVRPQAGLNDADIVFEHTAEGSITRFTAIFYGSSPESIGPIRSARLIDVELPAMYDAGLAFSGASSGVNQRLNNSDFQTRIIYSAEQGYFRTGADKPFEHTLYGDANGFHQALAAKGQNAPPNFVTHNVFNSAPPAGGQPGGYAAIDYQWETVEWRYDGANGRYWRWAADQPVLDANTGEQVSAANVVIIAPFHVEDPTICEEIANDTCIHLSVQIQLWGSGTGLLLRDGQQYNITWNRQGRNDSLTFTDASGAPFPLQIGNMWVQLVPSWYQEPVLVQP